MVIEACLPWDAIPDAANKYWNVDVVNVEESRRPNHPPFSIIIAANLEDADPNGPIAAAWRITFNQYEAYRLRPYGYPGNLPLTRPDNVKALWEVYPSQFLSESSAPEGISLAGRPVRLHHFVVCTGGNDVYEVIAAEWKSERLPDEWAHPFERPVPNN